MNKNEKFVITINRELGSGGRTVGELLAQRLGVPFYDKALVKSLQERFQLSIDDIERLKGRNHSWWAEFRRSMNIGYAASQSTNFHVMTTEKPDMLTTDEVFKAECEILRGMAESESCIVAGRSGFWVLRNHPNHLSIFIQASKAHRIARVAEKKGIGQAEAEAIIEEVDKMRENYVQRYTGTSRYDTRNYDLVINMNGKSEEQAADLIMNYIG